MQHVITLAQRHGATVTVTEGTVFMMSPDLETNAALVQALVDARLWQFPWQAACPQSATVFSNELARAFVAYYGHAR
jgi:hypothetical protein